MRGRVHLFAGGNDMPGFLGAKDRFVAHLRALDFPNVRVTDDTYSAESHMSAGLVAAAGVMRLVAPP